MNNNSHVGRLLVRWQKLRQQGRPPSVDDLCADCPELREEVGRQIKSLIDLEKLLKDSARPSDDDSEINETQLTVQAPRAEPPTDADDASVRGTVRRSGGSGGSGGARSGAPPSQPAPGVVHGYRLLERLGGGQFAVVYRALSSGGVEVAVKEIRYSFGEAEAQRELEALELIKGLRHPYLLDIHDFWVENDRLYVALQLADGTLADLAAAAGPNGVHPSEALPLFEQAAAALDFLHQNRILHRDVKPANILMTAGFAKVADLGLAKFNPDSVAVSQNLAGTYAYMAPEVFRNEFRPESDQYALALCYAEVRLGRQVCEGTNQFAVMHWHLNAVPNLEGLTPHEQKALRRALSKNPADRFRSCQEFVAALREPPPAPPRPRLRAWQPIAFALLLALPALGLVLWYHLATPTQTTPEHPDKPIVPPVVDLLPEGFVKSDGAKLELEADGKRYFSPIEKHFGGQTIRFMLIKDDEQAPFYMMDNKVTNGQFQAAWPDIKQQVKDLEAGYKPPPEWEAWLTKGGTRKNGTEIVPATDPKNGDLPVMRVNAIEAYCFARWCGGDLPTPHQWDRAAGKYSGAKEIWKDPDMPPPLGGDAADVAFGRAVQGPLAVTAATRDISVYGCRNMAGDGQEWTNTSYAGELFRPSRQPASTAPTLVLRGWSYRLGMPHDWSEDGATQDVQVATEVSGFLGFRVAIPLHP